MWAELHGAVIGSNTELGKKWIGSVRWKEADDKLFVCYLLGAERQLASISLPSMSVTNWAQRFAQYVEYLVPDSGKPTQTSERLSAYWSVGASQAITGSRFILVKDNSSGLQVKADSLAKLAPQVLRPYEIIDKQSQMELQDRRKLIEQAFGENSGPQSNLTYLEEAYYFVPVHTALQLQKRGHYVAALDWFRTVYDYTAPEESSPEERRKIYYGLVQEEKHAAGYQRVADWLRDPLNPHLIASTRPNTYTRFTILSIVRCLLDYADAEYTRDDSESVARARTLYDIALDLLAAGELKQTLGYCDERIGALLIELLVETPIEWNPAVWRLQDELKKVSAIQGVKEFQVVCAEVGNLLRTDEPWKNRLDQAQTLVDKALTRNAAFRTVATVLETVRREPAAGYTALLSDGDIFDAANSIGKTALTGFNGGTMFLQTPIVSPGKLAYSYCISPNPVPHALRLKAELNLHKIRTCRNIAGMKRTLGPYAAATDQVSGLPQIGANGTLMLPGATTLRPTQYRYSFLIERAKQLVNIAQQIEAAMLAALEKRDAEAYSQMKARQDIELAGAQVKLQTLRVEEAKDSVKLAELQQERAQIQVDNYRQLLEGRVINIGNACSCISRACCCALSCGRRRRASSLFWSWRTGGDRDCNGCNVKPISNECKFRTPSAGMGISDDPCRARRPDRRPAGHDRRRSRPRGRAGARHRPHAEGPRQRYYGVFGQQVHQRRALRLDERRAGGSLQLLPAGGDRRGQAGRESARLRASGDAATLHPG
jgi:hypothetical protein